MAQLHRPAHHVDPSNSPAPTVEQLLRGGEASKGSPKHRETEEDQSPHQKKSVLTKVKEKAKKLRNSLSKKKHDDNLIPSLVEDEDDEDTQYRGAPMNESELAPERNAEISEKHVLPSSVKSGVERDKETLSPSKSKRMTAHTPGPTDTMPMPDYSETHTLPSKFQGLSVSEPSEQGISSAPTTSRTVSSSSSSPKTPKNKIASQTFYDASLPPHASFAPVTPETSVSSGQIWDKGVSVKEYLMNKFEPGEDDKALSQVISEAMSPKTTPEDKGLMEKVRDAFTSLLRNDEPSQYAVETPVTQTSPEIPLSTNAYEVGEEASQGRILQAN